MAPKNDSGKVKYIPMIPQHPIDRKFHYYKEDGSLGIKADCTLVKSIEELEELAKGFEGLKIAVDTETTGLSYGTDFIVGFSISKDAYSGIYVPIRHQIKRVDKRKVSKTDDNGDVLYTKAGKPRETTVEDISYFTCEANLPEKEALDILYSIMLKAKISLIHNSEFDLNMIRQEGYDVTKLNTFDTMILPYIFDPEGRNVMGLKGCSSLMGRKVPEFKDVLGKEENFRYVDPEQGYEYACYDTMNCFYIYEKIMPMVLTLLAKAPRVLTVDGKKYNVLEKDNKLIKAFVDYYGHAELDIDRQVAIDYKEKIIKDLKEVSESIYTYFNKGQFNLSTSSKEFKDSMEEKNIVTGALTDKGAISFGKNGIKEFNKNLRFLRTILDNFDSVDFNRNKLNKKSGSKSSYLLSKIIATYGNTYFALTDGINSMVIYDKKSNKIEKDEFKLILEDMYIKEKEKLSVLVNIQKNSSLNKALNSYVDKLTKVDKCRIKYKLLATSSSRLASGNGSRSDKKKNHYYIDLNAQNLTKPNSCFYKGEKSEEDGNVLGWKFTQVTDKYAHKNKDKEVIVEGCSVESNIRNCIKASKDRYIMSLDYSSQESKILAILSQDSKMLEGYRKKIDPHTATAYAIWGEENYTKEKRKKAKTCLGSNSFVYTGTGLVRPYELLNTHKILDRNFNLQKYAMVKEEGNLIEVQYSTGIVEECTPNHKVSVWNGREIIWKEVKDLTKKDEVIQICNIHNVILDKNFVDTSANITSGWSKQERIININTSQFAYLVGIYLNRGTIKRLKSGKASSVCLRVEKPLHKEIYKVLEEMNIGATECYKESKGTKITIKHSPLSYLLSSIFGENLSTKKVPDYIFNNWNKSNIRHLIAGLMDSGGYFSNGAPFYDTTNLKLMQGIALACSSIGIKTNLMIKKRTWPNSKVTTTYSLKMFSMIGTTIPTRLENRKATNKISRCGNSWSLDKDYTKELYEKSKLTKEKKRVRRKLYSMTYYSSRLTEGDVLLFSRTNLNVPITPKMQCARVISKRDTYGNIYVIETENHEYISSCILSHNCNFLVNYGGGEYTLSEQLEIPLEEAREIIRGYEEAFFECIQWKKNEIQKMYRNNAVVFTEFGRPRQFGSQLRAAEGHEDVKKAAGIIKGVERKVSSHQIQGLCGDICRNVLLKLYYKFFKERNPDIDFISTVHDEINFSVNKSKLEEYAKMCEDIMTFDLLMKDLPINTSLEVGYSYGNCYPFIWADKERTKLIPKTI